MVLVVGKDEVARPLAGLRIRLRMCTLPPAQTKKKESKKARRACAESSPPSFEKFQAGEHLFDEASVQGLALRTLAYLGR